MSDVEEEKKKPRGNKFWNALSALEKKPAFAVSDGDYNYLQEGMTLREYYIGQALQGAISNQFAVIDNEEDAQNMAEGILVCVDALLERMIVI